MAMSTPGPDEIRAKVSARAFGSPVIQNDFRGFVAETIVESALGPTWRCCSGDWLGWDFEYLDGTRLEVKQSAARQTWAAPKRPSPPTFDIRTRSGFYVGSEWHPGVGRLAHVYVFAYHPIADTTANHLDPSQWVFYLVAAERLPANKSIGLARVTSLASAAAWEALFAAVEQLRLKRGGRPQSEFVRGDDLVSRRLAPDETGNAGAGALCAAVSHPNILGIHPQHTRERPPWIGPMPHQRL
jgi:hypothetical protein